MSNADLPASPAEIVQPAGTGAQPRRRMPARRPLERTAIGLMALGALMMFQPFALVLYSYSFIVFLLGAIMFTIVSHFPD